MVCAPVLEVHYRKMDSHLPTIANSETSFLPDAAVVALVNKSLAFQFWEFAVVLVNSSLSFRCGRERSGSAACGEVA
jgi:hypothetical protein